jgi:sortase A
MSRFDSIYRRNHQTDLKGLDHKKAKKIVPAFYYFYQSLRIVLVMWILMLSAIIVSPWIKYYAEKSVNKTSQQILGSASINSSTPKPVVTKSAELPKPVLPVFYFKKGDLEINAPIVEGISSDDLTKGIGHHPDSVWPTEKGNMVIAGHSFSLDANNIYGQVFARLREIEIGDEVQITYQNHKYIYKVFKKETMSATDMSLMGKSDKWQLTFYTCDPPKTDWRRLVFQAELVKIE